MATENAQQPWKHEYIRGGKGRKDEVGRSGVYPMSSLNEIETPDGAEIRGQGEFVRHTGPRERKNEEQDVRKSDKSSGSE
jgi:hypothetical protein